MKTVFLIEGGRGFSERSVRAVCETMHAAELRSKAILDNLINCFGDSGSKMQVNRHTDANGKQCFDIVKGHIYVSITEWEVQP